MKKMNKKGFTLAELLIVVAIIAVLVAVAIPVFTAQLEKSRDAVTVSNLRSAYAEATSTYLMSDGKAFGAATDHVSAAAATGGKQEVTVKGVGFKSQANGFSNMETELNFSVNNISENDLKTPGNYTVIFEYTTSDGSCTVKSVTKE